jgi:hypothetical protein
VNKIAKENINGEMEPFLTMFRLEDEDEQTEAWFNNSDNVNSLEWVNETGQRLAMWDAKEFLNSDKSVIRGAVLLGYAMLAMCSALLFLRGYKSRKSRNKNAVVKKAKDNYKKMARKIDNVPIDSFKNPRNADHNAPRVQTDIYIIKNSNQQWLYIFSDLDENVNQESRVTSPYVMVDRNGVQEYELRAKMKFDDCPCSTLLMACANSSQFLSYLVPRGRYDSTASNGDRMIPHSCYHEYLGLFDKFEAKDTNIKLLCIVTLIRHCVARVVRDEAFHEAYHANAELRDNRQLRHQISSAIQLHTLYCKMLYHAGGLDEDPLAHGAGGGRSNGVADADFDSQRKAIQSATHFVIDGVQLRKVGQDFQLQPDGEKWAIGIGRNIGSMPKSNAKVLYVTAEQNIEVVVHKVLPSKTVESYQKVPTLEKCLEICDNVTNAEDVKTIEARKAKLEYLNETFDHNHSQPVVGAGNMVPSGVREVETRRSSQNSSQNQPLKPRVRHPKRNGEIVRKR